MGYTYDHPRPAVTVDVIVFGLDEGSELKVLLIERAMNPFKGYWAIPGGFVNMDEPLEAAALRELEEETGIRDIFIEQLFTFGQPERDPRGRVISVAYYALINLAHHPVKASSDAGRAEWFGIEEIPDLAFDHNEIFEVAIHRLRTKVRYQPIGFELLPEIFTLPQLFKLYQTILGTNKINKRNFWTKILKSGILIDVGKQKGVAHRPARLYRFDKEKYQQMEKEKHHALIKRALDFEI